MVVADEFMNEKKPVFYWLALISGLFGLITPIVSGIVYWIMTLDVRDDGWIAAFVFGIGIIWWIVMSVIGIIFVIAGLIRKESGWIKLLGIISTVLSIAVLVGIFLFILIAGNLK